MKNKQHNSRRRRRDYGSVINNLAYAMIEGDVNGVKDSFERIVRYGMGTTRPMDRRDCEQFLREFRAEMEEKVPSKRQRSVGKEKAKRRNELRELEKQLGIKKGRKR